MKNLKRALSLALASVMLLGMMVVGAGAANFGDDDKIQNTEAVNTMASLGIIKGKDDGNFDPEGLVTRAEMAKMICVALNSGKDPNLTGGGLYPDTKNHWASGYIDYCTNMKIVSGDTAGNFNPDRTVTGSEAAKMILIALGYSAENEKFVNDASWELNINVIASSKGLYDDVAALPAQGLTRDNAAQMLYNGMDAEMVKYDYQLNSVNGNLTSVAIAEDRGPAYTIFQQKFDLLTKYGYMDGIAYDETKKTYTYSFDDNTTWTTLAAISSDDYVGASMKSEADYSDMFGMRVKVLYKNNTDKTVYGMYVDGSTVLYSGVCSDVTTPAAAATEVKIDGTTYKLDGQADATPVLSYNLNSIATKLDVAMTNGEYEFALVDVDDDGKGDLAVVLPFTVREVTFAGKDSITAGAGYDYEDHIIAEGIEKGDYVKIVPAANTVYGSKNVITKADVISGTVAGIKSNGDVSIDGTWYKKASTFSDSFTVGESYDVAVNGKFVYAAEQTSDSATVNDIVFVSASEDATKLNASRTEVYFMDGTKQVVNVTKVDGATITTGSGVTENLLYTFKVKNGDYELTTITSGNKAGFDGYNGTAGNFDEDKDRLGGGTGLYIADDAIVVVDNTVSGEREIKFFTGKAVKSWKSNYTAADGSYALYDTVNGLNTAKVVLMINNSGSTLPTGGTETYGYITSTPYRVKDGDDYYDTYTLWTKDGEITVLDEDDDLGVSKGAVIKYDDLGDGKIKTSTVVGTPVAIVGYDAKNIQMALADGSIAAYTGLTDDTQYLYVNSKDAKGVTGGAIDLATKQADGSYILNAWYVAGEGSDVDLIVFDVNNDIDGLANDASAGRAGYAVTIPNYSAGTGIANINTVDAVKWTVDGLEVANDIGTAYAIEGAEVVATVKGPSSALTLSGSTATIAGSVGAVAAVKTAPTFDHASGAVSAATTTVTVTKNSATTMTGGEFTFTWTVSGAFAPSVTGTN